MPTKKQLIIKAFEELDAAMLDVLLSDQAYDEVPKEVFVQGLQEYFHKMKSETGMKLDFKAVEGHCRRCYKGEKGYSFINSNGTAYKSFVFRETEDDFSDICSCTFFQTAETEYVKHCGRLPFYEDDKVSFKMAPELQKEQADCKAALLELAAEVQREGIVYPSFYLPWLGRYSYLDEEEDIFTAKHYRFKQEALNALQTIGLMSHMREQDRMAERYFHELMAVPVFSREHILPWLQQLYEEYFNVYFEYSEINYRQQYVVMGGLRFNLRDYLYLESLQRLLRNYRDWLPPYPAVQESAEEKVTVFNETDDLPF